MSLNRIASKWFEKSKNNEKEKKPMKITQTQEKNIAKYEFDSIINVPQNKIHFIVLY